MSSNSSDKFATAYPWISIGFFERILRREHHDDTIIVKDYTLKAALGKGENYLSQMLRVSVNYSSIKDPSVDHISLIVKAAISGDLETAGYATEMGLFRKEIIVYQKILPKVEKLLRSIGDNSLLSAKCYDANEELSYLVFEDLSASGYANVNRRSGLNVEHFKHVMTKVAKWHAATAVLLDEHPSIAQEHQNCMLLSENMKPVMLNSAKAMPDVVRQIPGYEHLAPKLERYSECVLQKITVAVERDSTAFNVLLHGDLWSNNIMFTFDTVTGRPTDAILHPSIAQEHQNCMLLSENMKPVMLNSAKAMPDVVRQIPGYEHLAPKLERYSECVLQKITVAVERDSTAFNVLLHGDLWSNNIMFTFDTVTGRPTDAILVDFQVGFVGAPVLDIVYTLFLSSSESLLVQDWNEIVVYYHGVLVRLLKELGYAKAVPTLDELQADLLKRAHYSATLGMYALGARNLENVEDDQMEKFVAETTEAHQNRVKTILNPKVRNALKFLLQYSDDIRLFDV